MRAAPGSLWWLLRQQARVSWRAFGARWVVWTLGAGVLVLLIGSLLLAQPLRTLGASLAGVHTLSGLGTVIAGLGSLFLFSLMLSAAIGGTLETLYERGDLDLLLSSPLPPARVLAARLLGVTLAGLPLFSLLALLVTVPALVGGVWRLLGVWPWLLSLALLATALGAALTLGLVKVMGVRRARTLAGVLSALIGAAFFLVSQAGNLLGGSSGRTGVLTRWLARQLDGTLPAANTALWWPGRALWLEPFPTAGLLLLSVLAFMGVSSLLARVFVRGAQLGGSPGRLPALAGGPLRFADARRAVLLKEWRLLRRDPLLLSRTLLQVLYLIPLGFSLLRGSSANLTPRLLGLVGIFALGSLTSNLAQITVNAEDAPDLLLASPTPLGRLRWLKWWAAVLPVFAVWSLLLLAGIISAPQWQTLLGLLLGLLSMVGSAVIVLWRPLQLRRADLMQRRQGSDTRGSLLQMGLQAGLLAALFWLPLGGLWTLAGAAGLAIALAIPLTMGLQARRST